MVNGKFKYTDIICEKDRSLTIMVKYWEQLLFFIILYKILLIVLLLRLLLDPPASNNPLSLFQLAQASSKVLFLLLCQIVVSPPPLCINKSTKTELICLMLLFIYLDISLRPFFLEDLLAQPGHFSLSTPFFDLSIP